MKNRYLILLIAGLMITMFSCDKDDHELDYPTQGLVSYFNFNGNLSDVVGNTPDGIGHGGVDFTQGRSGKALTLNGIDQYVEWQREGFVSGNIISVSVWIKKELQGGLRRFLNSGEFRFGTTNDVANFSITVTPTGTKTADGSIVNDSWIHLVGIYDGQDIRIYVNEFLAETVMHPGSLNHSGIPFTVGNQITGDWAGSIDELFIYDRILSEEEIHQLYTR